MLYKSLFGLVYSGCIEKLPLLRSKVPIHINYAKLDPRETLVNKLIDFWTSLPPEDSTIVNRIPSLHHRSFDMQMFSLIPLPSSCVWLYSRFVLHCVNLGACAEMFACLHLYEVNVSSTRVIDVVTTCLPCGRLLLTLAPKPNLPPLS